MVFPHFNNGVSNIIDRFYQQTHLPVLDISIPFLTILDSFRSDTNEYLIKSDLLSYTTGDDLQHVMDVFIREVRRPTGEEYLPESIYYLCLGIHFYLKINNRQIDLFDSRYVEFNSTLNKILSNYSPRISPDCKLNKISNSSLFDFFFLSEYICFIN